MAVDADAKTAPKPPPNLRIAEDEAKECETCTHYDRGKCAKYSNLPVDDEWVCDSWANSGKPDDDSPDEPDESPAKNVRQAEQNARNRFRVARRQEASGQESGKP